MMQWFVVGYIVLLVDKGQVFFVVGIVGVDMIIGVVVFGGCDFEYVVFGIVLEVFWIDFECLVIGVDYLDQFFFGVVGFLVIEFY